MALRAAVFVAVALAVAGAASAQTLADTTGKSLTAAPGYKFASQVAGYTQVSADVCEIVAVLSKPTPDFAAAKKLYTAGKNSKKSDGSLRHLKGMATGDYSGGLFWDTYTKHFKSPTFLDDLAGKALDGAGPYTSAAVRRQAAEKGIAAGIVLAYSMHELDEAAGKLKEGLTEDKDGAPHNVDEAAALYIGAKSECAPWALSNQRAAAFGTQATCAASKANLDFVKAINAALAAARKGDQAAYQAARNRVQSVFAILGVQGTIEFAEEMEEDRAAGNAAGAAEDQAAAFAMFRTIEPLVAQASASSAATISKLLTPGSPIVAGANKQIAAALDKAYPGLGITKADVGTYGAKSTLKC